MTLRKITHEEVLGEGCYSQAGSPIAGAHLSTPSSDYCFAVNLSCPTSSYCQYQSIVPSSHEVATGFISEYHHTSSQAQGRSEGAGHRSIISTI